MSAYKARIRGDKGQEQVLVSIEDRQECFWFGMAVAHAKDNYPTSRIVVPEMDYYIEYPNDIEHPVEIQAGSIQGLGWNIVKYLHNIKQLEAVAVA